LAAESRRITSKNFPQNKLQFIVIERIELRLPLPFLFTSTSLAHSGGKEERRKEGKFHGSSLSLSLSLSSLFCVRSRSSVAVL
jgi:hypothetical protein